MLKARLHVTDPVEEILVLSLGLVSCSTWILCVRRVPGSVLLLKQKGNQHHSAELYLKLLLFKEKVKTNKQIMLLIKVLGSLS